MERGRACLERAAEGGYAPAQVLLAYTFESGSLGERNMRLALTCYETATDAADLDASFHLARCYATGTGVPVSHAKAFELCSRSAQGGHLAAQLVCAFCLQRGWGTALDACAAAELLGKASAAGANRLASFSLALCYATGDGVEPDSDKAGALYRMAFDVPQASDLLERLQPEQQVAALRTLISASEGSASAHYALALCYQNGVGTTVDPSAASHHLSIAANLSHVSAQALLGTWYQRSSNGMNPKQDRTAAAEWFSKAANKGDPIAMYNLALCFQSGCGVPESSKEAMAWLFRCSEHEHAIQRHCEHISRPYVRSTSSHELLQSYLEQFRALAADKDANAQFVLGCCYEGDQAAASSWTEALQCYTRASEQGHPTALLRLGCMFGKGLGGVKCNVNLAKAHYERALAMGQPLAVHGPLHP
jgi:hypothetical protein